MTKENKCKSYLDHNPVWAGDGYFCSECMIRFVPKESYRQEIIEKIVEIRDLTKSEQGKTLDFWEGYTKAVTKIYKIIKENE